MSITAVKGKRGLSSRQATWQRQASALPGADNSTGKVTLFKPLFSLLSCRKLAPKQEETQGRTVQVPTLSALRLSTMVTLPAWQRVDVGADEVGLDEVGAVEVGAAVVGMGVLGADEVGADEVGADEVGADEVGAAEEGAAVGAAVGAEEKERDIHVGVRRGHEHMGFAPNSPQSLAR